MVCVRCGIERDASLFKNRSAKCWECRKEMQRIYKKTEAAKIAQKKCREKHKKEYKITTSNRIKTQTEQVTDRYVIGQLMNRNKKPEYSAAYLKANPQIIEAKRTQILINRIKKVIEKVSDKGIYTSCNSVVPITEFRVQRATEKKPTHKQRMCNKCRKEYSKQYWSKNKPKK